MSNASDNLRVPLYGVLLLFSVLIIAAVSFFYSTPRRHIETMAEARQRVHFDYDGKPCDFDAPACRLKWLNQRGHHD